MPKLKLFVIFSFFAFAGCAFLYSGSKTDAQTGKTDDVLGKISDYKTWKQVQKTEEKKEIEIVATGVLSISNSSVAG